MHIFEAKIQTTIKRHGLLRPGARVVVALSGGADSVALLNALVCLGYDCRAAHCNYHLRGEESNRDMRHAEAVCQRLGVPVAVRDFDVAARRMDTGESVEMACRALRYEWFGSIVADTEAEAVAVAHHCEDNVETFFLNLMRTTGITGLTGMDYRRGKVVRPMLDVTRADVEAYLGDAGLAYVVDSTNAENEYRRNRLRNIVLPALEANFPGAERAVSATMKHLRAARCLVDDAVAMWAERVGVTADSIDVSALISAAGADRAATVVYELMKGRGINATQAGDIVDAVASGRSGGRYALDHDVAVVDRGVLNVISAAGNDGLWKVSLDEDIVEPIYIKVERHDVVDFKVERNPRVAFFDERILGEVITLRHPRPGDRFRPFGMRGTRLLSDLFNDAKLSTAERRSAWVMVAGDRIVWVVGMRAAADFAVKADTVRYIRTEVVGW